MPHTKSAYLRYQIIDESLSKSSMKYPSSEMLLSEISRILDKQISKETLQKDIHQMKYSSDLKFYAPIKYSRSYGGYYYSDPDYSIKQLPIKYDEIESAEFVLSLLRQSGALPYLNRFENLVDRVFTFSKVENKLKRDLSDIIQFQKPKVVEGLKWIEPLVDAIQLRQVIQITYRSIQRGITDKRNVHPYLVKENEDRWYLFGYDEVKEDENTFALERIIDLSVVPKKKYQSYNGNLKDVYRHVVGISRDAGNPQKVTLKFKYPQTEYILSKPIHHSQKIIDQTEDSVTIELFVKVNYELKALIRSYGGDVKIISPESCKLP